MDPASIIGLTVAIQQVLTGVYRFGEGIREARKEINQLCSELFALKAALDHIRLNIDINGIANLDISGKAHPILPSSNFATPEFISVLSTTDAILKDLLTRLDAKPSRFTTFRQKLIWPIVKDDVKLYIDRLERSKSWLILATTSDNTALCRESYNKIYVIDRRLQHQEHLQEERENAEFRRSVKTWLAPHNPKHFYERSLEVYQEGTGKWLLENVFQAWLGGHSLPILWLRAKPGVGKTTLLSAAIKRAQLLDNPHSFDRGLAYFFCSFTDQKSQNPRNLFGSLLVQLCERHPALWNIIDDRYHKGKLQFPQGLRQLELHEMEDLVVLCSNQLSKTFIFLDALNESNQSSELLSTLLRIIQRAASVRIMMSSTENIGTNSASYPAVTIGFELDKTAGDIKSYIEAWLGHNEDLRDLPPVLKEEIKSALQKKADGVFRWVQCQLEALVNQNTPRAIRETLRNVPDTLGLTYTSILARISKNNMQLARQALFWLSFSLVPMTFDELCDAVIIRESDIPFAEDMRLLHPKSLLSICSSLISYSDDSSEVTLAHSSVQVFLTSEEIQASNVRQFYLDTVTAHNTICSLCLRYLCLPAFSSGYCTSDAAVNERFDQWPLLPYISETLSEHLHYITLDKSIQILLLRFFATHKQPRGGNFGAWVQAWIPESHASTKSSTPLYYAARYGMLPLVKVILATEGTANLEVPGGVYGSTPLHVAAWQGQTDVVEELLKAGANPKERNDEGKPGLLWAVKYGLGDIEQILREAGATLDDVIDPDDESMESPMVE